MIFTRSQSSCQSQSYIKDFVDKRLQAPSQAYTIAVLYWCLAAYHPPQTRDDQSKSRLSLQKQQLVQCSQCRYIISQ